jgi:hypothetical protein
MPELTCPSHGEIVSMLGAGLAFVGFGAIAAVASIQWMLSIWSKLN